MKTGQTGGKRNNSKSNKFFVVDAGTYPFDVACFFGEDRKPLLSHMKKHATVEELITLKGHKLKRGMAWIVEGGQSVLWLPKIPRTITEKATLNHEIWHVTDNILRRVGITLSEDSTEAYAYLLQYLSVKIWTNLNSFS